MPKIVGESGVFVRDNRIRHSKKLEDSIHEDLSHRGCCKRVLKGAEMSVLGVTHDFGCHDDVLMMVYSGSSLEISPEKSYLHLFPEITFLRTIRRLLVYLPTRMHDSRRLP